MTTSRLRVVIVDDEELARAALRHDLAALGDVEIVAECANGFEAVRAIGERHPDLVLLDVQMPKLDGPALYHRLTELRPSLSRHMVFVTGDVATIDPDGFMEITDRSKDVIKSGGEWISSIQLENIAISHPDVLEAAVIAVMEPLVPQPLTALGPAALSELPAPHAARIRGAGSAGLSAVSRREEQWHVQTLKAG